MTTLVAIAYPDEEAAAQARTTVWQLEKELIIQAERRGRGLVRERFAGRDVT